MANDPDLLQQPVTVVYRTVPAAGRQEAFEQWLKRITQEARAIGGCVDAEVYRPRGPEREYVTLISFRTRAELHAWEESEARQHLLREAEELRSRTVEEKLSGLEFWFTIGSKQLSPARHRMIAVTWIGLYPLVQFLAPWMVGTLRSWGLPEPVAVMLNVAAILVVMTYLVMPQLTRLLRRFLQA